MGMQSEQPMLQAQMSTTLVRLNVIGTVKTGDVAGNSVTSGCAIRIFTEPCSRRAQIQLSWLEDTVFKNDSIQVSAPLKTNKNIRRTGEEFAKDSICLPKSTKLTPAAIGLTATLGYQSGSSLQKASRGACHHR
ncbi:MAG: hypothetical protein IPH10_11105 [bacterium]|nr:hypothetical protein [bacterium]